MTLRNAYRPIRRRSSSPSSWALDGTNRLQALAFVLLYIGGIVVIPSAHKAAVCLDSARKASHGYTATCNTFTEVASVSSCGQAQHHNPSTCPICQLVSTPQIVGEGTMQLASWRVVLANVCVAADVYGEPVRADSHRARGPPLTS